MSLSKETAPMLTLVESGKVRGLTVEGEKRILPDVSTSRELGYDVDLRIWRRTVVRERTKARNFRNALLSYRRDSTILFTRPISAACLMTAFCSHMIPVIRDFLRENGRKSA